MKNRSGNRSGEGSLIDFLSIREPSPDLRPALLIIIYFSQPAS